MPLRAKLILFGVVVLLLFTGLGVGFYLSLDSAIAGAERDRERLLLLSQLESLERDCRLLETPGNAVACRRARKGVERLLARGWAVAPREPLVALAAAVAGPAEPDPALLRPLIAEARAAVHAGLTAEGGLPEEDPRRSGVRLLVVAGLAAAGGAATFAWLYSRLVRERRALEDRVRRSEKLAALGTLAAGVAHEINNPLASISISAEALCESLPRESREAVYCQAIQEEAARCMAIVTDLSDLARGGSLDREPVDPAELVEEALRLLERRRPKSGVAIETRVSDGLPLLSADRRKLLLVLLNLLQNAVEACEPGGRVQVTAGASDGRVDFTVTDDGRGMPPHILDRIFEPFFTDKPAGVGLGLTLCHRIAELHGGEVTAESAGAGRGSTFTLSVPLSRNGDGA